jgi:hypothetical protein
VRSHAENIVRHGDGQVADAGVVDGSEEISFTILDYHLLAAVFI